MRHDSYMRAMTHSCASLLVHMWHDAFIKPCHAPRVTWLIHIYDVTHSYVWRDSFICVTHHDHVWHVSFIYVTWLVLVWHDSFIYVTWLILPYVTRLVCHAPRTNVTWLIYIPWSIHICDMTHSYEWHDSFIRVTWLLHMCHVIRSYVWRDSLIFATSRIHKCDVTHWYVPYGLFMHATWLIEWMDKLCVIWRWHTSRMNKSFRRREDRIWIMWNDSFIQMTHSLYVKWLIHTNDWFIVCEMTHSYNKTRVLSIPFLSLIEKNDKWPSFFFLKNPFFFNRQFCLSLINGATSHKKYICSHCWRLMLVFGIWWKNVRDKNHIYLVNISRIPQMHDYDYRGGIQTSIYIWS